MRKKLNIIKYVFQIAVALVAFVVIFVEVSYAFRPKLETWDQEKNNFLGYRGEEENSIDVLNLGGSEVFTYCVPPQSYEEYGYTSYNYGVSGLRPPTYAPLLEEALKTQSPKLVVIGLRAFAIDYDEVEDGYFRWAADMLPYSYTRFKLVKAAMPYMVDVDGNRITESSSFYLDLIKYHQSYENLSFENWLYNSGRKIPEHIQKGYLLSTSVEEIELVDNTKVTEVIPVSKMAKESLEAIFDELNEHNLKALFVVTPFKTDKERTARINYLKQMITDAGFDYLDGNEFFDEIGMNGKTDYYNQGHVNIKGATKFTSFLGKYITENYDIGKSDTIWDTSAWDKLKKESLESMK